MSCVIKAKKQNFTYLVTDWQNPSKPFCCHFILWSCSGRSFLHLCTFSIWLLACFMSPVAQIWFCGFLMCHDIVILQSISLCVELFEAQEEGLWHLLLCFIIVFLLGWRSCHIESEWFSDFQVLTMLCDHHLCVSPKYSHIPRRKLCPCLATAPCSLLPPQTLAKAACYIYILGGLQNTLPE